MTQNHPHIIIVDDEAPAREMVGDYLKMHGFGVTLCDGGKSLRSVIETNVPDLVVLDLNMPEEDGLSIIRDLKSRINVPVIMLTATASPIDAAAEHAGQGGRGAGSRGCEGGKASTGAVRHQMAGSRSPGAARR